MLTDLVVSDLGVIDRAEVEFREGSTALTGETGAGKTLVVAALGLLLGERADRSMVRAGTARALVEGRWELSPEHPVVALLTEHGLLEDPLSEPVELLVSRSVDASGGSSRCRINGSLIPARLLGQICGELVEITGQHLHRWIGRPEWQRGLLDRFAGDESLALAAQVAERVRQARATDRALAELHATERERTRELDVLRFEIDEIERARLSPGELERLRIEASRLDNAAELAGALGTASERLTAEGGVVGAIGEAERALAGAVELDPEVASLAERLEAARYELDDVAAELRARIAVPDESRLEEARARSAEITRLLRKYGTTEQEVLDYLASAKARLEELGGKADESASLEARTAALWGEARDVAERLSHSRRAAVDRLQKAVLARLSELAMPDADFVVQIDEHELSEGGAETITFLLSANPGEPPKPLTKAASGGELSRTALALQLVAADAGATGVGRVMVFDEVDAGVGGEAARSVGACLAELGARGEDQVIVVTHLPQVASCTDHHLKVSKGADGGTTRASVLDLTPDERVEEISRMLAGLPESERAQEHARELLGEKVP